jgi:2-polyprenyl-3-methyl-5-hydroxy-6-metoxy-1,4-benzoquinol methylase
MMTTSPTQSTTDAVTALVDRLFEASVDAMDLIAVAIGDRLGFYETLDRGPGTPESLAADTGTSPRYAREWLEQQAMTGFLEVHDGAFTLAPGVAEALARRGTTSWVAPMARQVAAAAAQWTRVADAAVAGSGLGWTDYGQDMFESQSDLNAAALLESLADAWLPAALPDLHARMVAGEPLRVADIGCGGGWAGIALARRFPALEVDGYDVDAATVALARRNVETEGLTERVRVLHEDPASSPRDAQYDLVMAYECVHDMPDPVSVLAAMRGMTRPGGHVLVADMAGAEEFTPDGDLLQRALYGYSVLVCLPDAMSGNPEGATGTVMRPATMNRYAREAGFAAAVPLDVEHDSWRFYELTRGPELPRPRRSPTTG